jgi:hypothetical protein
MEVVLDTCEVAMDTAKPLCLLWVFCLVGVAAQPASRWDDLGATARPLEAIAPTPAGESHLGLVRSGETVQIRVPVPREPLAGYWLSLANVVAYTGKGTSYQLVLRRDSPQGEVIHTGPVIAQGDAWNAANREPVDITSAITAQDRERGYLDVYATGIVADDGWTLYRHHPNRPVLAYAAIETEDMRRQVAVGKALAERHIAILPAPRQVEFAGGTLILREGAAIVVPVEAPGLVHSAAEELREIIAERTGVQLTITPGARAPAGAVVLTMAADGLPADRQPPAQAEGYLLQVTGQGARVNGRDAAGCFYGAMTLGQMAQPAPAGGVAFPVGRIVDWPAFPLRIIQYDLARGQTIDVEYVQRMIRELARCKVNGLLFYMEDDFQFRKYPFLGRPGTFTHDKARQLAEFARRFGVQLIPQFEALGHADAVLRHDELAALREAGGNWLFCTSAPETWTFLDDVFGELAEAFPDTPFIHTGGDEFEPGFAQCARCQATAQARGVGGLYADHMNHLNALVKKHGRTMLFWPSHHGPTPELNTMTLQYRDQLEKDCIPTEWIYHGPATYPTIEAYQKAGFKDVFCSPAVESYSRVWPDYVTTLRAVRGFYRTGVERGCGGAYCTTWEFMHGALWENSWYGLLFAAECSWNPASTRRLEYTRRFADVWWGITPADEALAATVDAALFDPLPSTGPAALWHSGVYLRDLLWAPASRVLREFALKRPEVAANVDGLSAAVEAISPRLDTVTQAARRNQFSLRSLRLGVGMTRYAAAKLSGMQQASAQYRGALTAGAAGADKPLGEVHALLAGLQRQAETVATEYRYFVEHCGAYAGDGERLAAQAVEFGTLAATIAQARAGLAATPPAALPPAADLGFLQGSYTRVGEWVPAQMSEEKAVLRLDITPFLKAPGEYWIEWEYTHGAHALAIFTTQLIEDGQLLAEDRHAGHTGASHSQNVYHLVVKELRAGAKLELVAETASRGGTDSNGTVWLVADSAAGGHP